MIPSVPSCFRRGLSGAGDGLRRHDGLGADRPASAARRRSVSTQPAAPVGPVRRISIDEAVTMALQQNVSLQVQKMNPGISELDVVQSYGSGCRPHRPVPVPEPRAAGGHDPAVGQRSNFQQDQWLGNFGVDQFLPTGGSYSLGYQALAQREQQPVRDAEPEHAGQPDVLFYAAAAAQPLHRHHPPADPGQQEQPRDQRDGLPQHRREHRPRRQERVLGSRRGAVGPRRCSGRRWNCRCRPSATTASASRSARWRPSTSCRRKPKWPRTRRT